MVLCSRFVRASMSLDDLRKMSECSFSPSGGDSACSVLENLGTCSVPHKDHTEAECKAIHKKSYKSWQATKEYRKIVLRLWKPDFIEPKDESHKARHERRVRALHSESFREFKRKWDQTSPYGRTKWLTKDRSFDFVWTRDNFLEIADRTFHGHKRLEGVYFCVVLHFLLQESQRKLPDGFETWQDTILDPPCTTSEQWDALHTAKRKFRIIEFLGSKPQVDNQKEFDDINAVLDYYDEHYQDVHDFERVFGEVFHKRRDFGEFLNTPGSDTSPKREAA